MKAYLVIPILLTVVLVQRGWEHNVNEVSFVSSYFAHRAPDLLKLQFVDYKSGMPDNRTAEFRTNDKITFFADAPRDTYSLWLLAKHELCHKKLWAKTHDLEHNKVFKECLATIR